MDIESLIESSWEATGYAIRGNVMGIFNDLPKSMPLERTIVIYGVSREDIIKQTEHLIKIDSLTTYGFKPDGARLQITRVEVLNLTSINRGFFSKSEQEDDLYVGRLTEQQREFLKKLLI